MALAETTLGEMGSRTDCDDTDLQAGAALDHAIAAGVVDTMVTVPGSRDAWQKAFAGLIKDKASEGLEHPAGYMFNDLPQVDGEVDYLAYLLSEMDMYGVERALIPVAVDDVWGRRGVDEHPDRLHGVVLVDPHDGVAGLRMVRRMHAAGHVVAAACFPSGCLPPVPIDAALLYPLYALCCELDIPVMLNVGVPGPRFPMASQHVGGLDRVCYDFPDLVVITRHGGEPWESLLVKLMLKWPNLYYSTSAFAPKYYPDAIVDYANTRGAHKVIYAGYFPSGLTLQRIFAEFPDVGFHDSVWKEFLRENAMRVFKLG